MKLIYIILGALLVTLAGAIVVVSFANPIRGSSRAAEAPLAPIKHHFVMIAQGGDDSFIQGVQDGAHEAARELGAAVETHTLWLPDEAAVADALSAMIAARVDGIAVRIENEELCLPIIEQAQDVPIVIFESGAQAYSVPSIGSSSFQLGNEAGRLAIEASQGAANVGLILSGRDEQQQPETNLFMQGLTDAFSQYPDMQITAVSLTGGLKFGAAEKTNEILRDHPDVNMIIATNDKDTLGVVDVVVDANRLPTMTIIGYGTLPETIKYVESGVIYGTVASDPEQIGYRSVKTLAELHLGNYTSNYLSTDIYSYTAENAHEYTDREERGDGARPS